MIAFFLLVLAVYSLHGIVVLTWDVLSFPFKIVGVASYFRTPIVPLSLAVFPVVLLYFCVFQLLWSLYVSLHFFVLFFEVYTHRYTSWSCIQPSLCVLLVKRQKITSPKNFHLLAKGTVSWRAVHRREAPCLLALLLEHWFN